MELRPVKSKSKQDYPVFDDYWKNRRHYMKEAALCAGIMIGASALTSCDKEQVEKGGVVAVPEQPVNQTQTGNTVTEPNTPTVGTPNTGSTEARPALKGSMPAPSNVEGTVNIAGDMPMPVKPAVKKPAPELQDVKKMGEIVAPTPPEPRKMGKMVAPQAPEKK